MRRFVALLLLSSSLLVTGCMGSKHAWRAQPIATEEVRVVPQEVYRRKNRLFVRATFYNLGSSWLTVDRDAVSCQLENGHVLARSAGTTTLHKPYSIPPGGVHSVYVDFKSEDIEDVGAAHVFWTGAVYDGARQVMIPATPVQGR